MSRLGYCYFTPLFILSTVSVVLVLPLDFPSKEVEGREGCYPEDTAYDRMEIDEEIRQILREYLTAIGSITSGSGQW